MNATKRFGFCFGDIRRNRDTLCPWQTFGVDLTSSSAWNQTGYNKHDFEGGDWGWAEAMDMKVANYDLAARILEKYGFRRSRTAWGEDWFDAPSNVPIIKALP